MISLFSPKVYSRVCNNIIQFGQPAGFLLLAILLYLVINAPNEVTQGSIAKLIYLHVPFALASQTLFMVVTAMASLSWVYHIKVAHHIASISARLGYACTSMTLITGMIWGYFTWGSFWVWEPRLTTYLMLWLIYLAYITMDNAVNEYRGSKRSLMIIALIGAINTILVHFSVNWWQSIHQTSSLLEATKGTLPQGILLPLVIAILTLGIWVTVGCARYVLKAVHKKDYA